MPNNILARVTSKCILAVLVSASSLTPPMIVAQSTNVRAGRFQLNLPKSWEIANYHSGGFKATKARKNYHLIVNTQCYKSSNEFYIKLEQQRKISNLPKYIDVKSGSSYSDYHSPNGTTLNYIIFTDTSSSKYYFVSYAGIKNCIVNFIYKGSTDNKTAIKEMKNIFDSIQYTPL